MSADNDAEILRLFWQWIATQRAIDRIPGDQEESPEYLAALDALDRIEGGIAATPASGAVGLAVKIYLITFFETGGTNEEAGALGSLEMCWASSEQIASAIRDCARIVPELAPLAVRLTDGEKPAAGGEKTEAASGAGRVIPFAGASATPRRLRAGR